MQLGGSQSLARCPTSHRRAVQAAAGAGFAAPARSSSSSKGGKGRRPQQRRARRQAPIVQQGQEEDADDDAAGALSELSQVQHVITVPDFAPELCRELRQVFDDRFQDPRHTTEERFLWDYFHIPNQYTMHRTQAGAYFPEALHERLVDTLLEYGEKQLGCRAITPIWMSYYIDGCVQELHCDNPHGPFAFVLSLTAPGLAWADRRFTGGETAILQPQLLGGFWQHCFQSSKGLELPDLMRLVPSPFGQLTVFDPRLPHGVRPVSGTKDPQQGRLVLHGWYTDPSPFFDGPLSEEQALEPLNAALEPMFEQLQALPPVLGTLSTRITVSGATGCVEEVSILADTLVAPPAAAGDELGGGLLAAGTIRGAVQHTIVDHLKGAEFPSGAEGADGGDTAITLPLVFD